MSKERKKSGRRKLLKLGVKGAVTLLAFDIANHYFYAFDQPNDLEKKLKYETDYALSLETRYAELTGYKFGYLKSIPEDWGFENFDGAETLTMVLPEELAVFRRYNELQFTLRGADVSPTFPGIYVSSYLDSTDRLVPKISFVSGVKDPVEYALLGHLSQPLGSFSRGRPDIIRIFNEYYPTAPTYYVSMTVTEARGRFRTTRAINVTPLRLVPLAGE